MPITERGARRVLREHRATQRHLPKDNAGEQRLTADIIALANDYGRYGYLACRLADQLVTGRADLAAGGSQGAEEAAEARRLWPGRVGVTILYTEPGSPWENGYIESRNARLRDELPQRRDLLQPRRGADRPRLVARSL